MRKIIIKSKSPQRGKIIIKKVKPPTSNLRYSRLALRKTNRA